MRTGSIRESEPDLPRENVPETVQTPGVLWKSQARHCPAPTMQAAGRSESSDPQLIEAATETAQLQSEFRVVRSGTRYRGAVVYGPAAERRADCERRSRPLTVCNASFEFRGSPEPGISTSERRDQRFSRRKPDERSGTQDALATTRPSPGTAV